MNEPRDLHDRACKIWTSDDSCDCVQPRVPWPERIKPDLT